MIALRAWNGRYLTADVRDAAVCTVDTSSPAAQQRFTVVKARENRIFLRSCFGTNLSINTLGFVGFHTSMGGCEEFTVIFNAGKPVFKGYGSGKFLYINNDGSASGAFAHTESKNRFDVEFTQPVPPGSAMAAQLQRAFQMRTRYAQLDDNQEATSIASAQAGLYEFGYLAQVGTTFMAVGIGADKNVVYNNNIQDIIQTPVTVFFQQPQAAPSAVGGPVSWGGLPPGWRELRTPDGKVYYADDNTGTTSWTRPM